MELELVQGFRSRDDLTKMWVEVFGDSEDYVRLFTESIPHCKNTFTLYERDSLAAMLFALHVEAVWGQRVLQGAYVYAVATAETCRGRGFSTKLLEFCNNSLVKQGADFSMLTPATQSLFAFYGRQGYDNLFSLAQLDLEEGQLNGLEPLVLLESSLAQQQDLRNSFFAKAMPFIRWPKEILCHMDKEIIKTGGRVLAFEGGYMLCYKTGENLLIKELAGSLDPRPAILSAMRHFKLSSAHVRLWQETGWGKAECFAMLKPLSGGAKEMLCCKKDISPYFSLALD